LAAYLNSEYHSRFEAMEYWWTAPRQVDRLSHVLRQGSRPQPQQLVYKEPFFALAPELVAEGLPDAKILYIYRDGRDVANSLVASYDVLTDEKLTDLRSTEARLGRRYDNRYVPWWVADGREADFLNSSPFVRSIWMWTFMVQRCHRYFQNQDDGQVLQLQYEAFMHRPQEHGRRILDHLGASETHGFRTHLERARTSSIGKHEHRSPSELKAAHRVAAPMLTTLGYD
jgi:hypothetical protein